VDTPADDSALTWPLQPVIEQVTPPISQIGVSAVVGCQAGSLLTDASGEVQDRPSGRWMLLAHQSGSSPRSRREGSMFAACNHCPPLEPQNFQRSSAARL